MLKATVARCCFVVAYLPYYLTCTVHKLRYSLINALHTTNVARKYLVLAEVYYCNECFASVLKSVIRSTEWVHEV